VKYPSSLFIAPSIRAISRATLGISANMVIMSFSVFLFVDSFVFNVDETGHGIVCGICAQGGACSPFQPDNTNRMDLVAAIRKILSCLWISWPAA
ncbi:hypothetical protein NE694_21530, partial [Phocaeicola vulgatus]|uniref:hypothetical protein n=1 Tax=Phocaeicola vulgatus TaxID=821 RepID=UPI0021096A20